MGGVLNKPAADLANDQIERAFALAAGENNQHKILAAGVGELASLIASLAQKLDIPIHRDPELARLLSGISPQAALPPEAAKLVSEVLSFLIECDRQAKPF